MRQHIKIRFIERKNWDYSVEYTIQQKTWCGWNTIKYVTYDILGGKLQKKYRDKSVYTLLETVLVEYFKTCKKFVKITEYPSLKIY